MLKGQWTNVVRRGKAPEISGQEFCRKFTWRSQGSGHKLTHGNEKVKFKSRKFAHQDVGSKTQTQGSITHHNLDTKT